MTWWRRWIGGDGFVSWTQAVQSLKADRPLDLPPIRPLMAVKAKKERKTKTVSRVDLRDYSPDRIYRELRNRR